MISEDLTSGRDLKPAHFSLRLFRNKYAWLAMTPFVVLLLVVTYRGVQELRANQAIKQQIAQWDKEQVPYDNDSMQAHHLKRTFPAGYADWAKVLRLTEWGSRTESYHRIPYVGYEAEPPEVLVPNDKNNQWTDDALVAGYLEEMQPVIDLVEQASTYPTPVRFPMHFQGFNTMLPHIQNARSVARILSLDCEYAYSHGETRRALRDLSLTRSTVDAFDSRHCLVSLLVSNAVREIRFRSIRRTLVHCIWDESQLVALRESLSGSEDIAEPSREAIVNERALALASLSDLTSLEQLYDSMGEKNRVAGKTVMPSDVQLLLEYYNDILKSSDDSVLQWKKRAEDLEHSFDTNHSSSIASLLYPATSQFITSEIAGEERRRWTLTAVVLRQYHQQRGSWPKQLSDLESLGLVFADYSNVHGEIFGYEVDGDSAWLWKSDPNNNGAGRVSSTRPTEKEEGESLDAYLLELHAS